MDNAGALSSPPGRFIEIEGRTVHWREWGAPTDRPTIMLECGLGLMSGAWGRLGPLLGAATHVVAWDRPGLGWSEEREGIREAGQISRELLHLLKRLEIETPLVLVGHSLGAMIARAAFARVPDKFAGLIFLDGAHHDQMREPKTRRRMRNYFLFLEAANLLAARGVPMLNLPIGSELDHLPEPDRSHALTFLKNARHLRTSAREARAWNRSCEIAAPVALGALPLLVVTAQKHCLPGWTQFQTELAHLSSASNRLTLTDASHISLLCHQPHAEKVAESIMGWLKRL